MTPRRRRCGELHSQASGPSPAHSLKITAFYDEQPKATHTEQEQGLRNSSSVEGLAEGGRKERGGGREREREKRGEGLQLSFVKRIEVKPCGLGAMAAAELGAVGAGA